MRRLVFNTLTAYSSNFEKEFILHIILYTFFLNHWTIFNHFRTNGASFCETCESIFQIAGQQLQHVFQHQLIVEMKILSNCYIFLIIESSMIHNITEAYNFAAGLYITLLLYIANIRWISVVKILSNLTILFENNQKETLWNWQTYYKCPLYQPRP